MMWTDVIIPAISSRIIFPKTLGIFRNFAQNFVVSHSKNFDMLWTDVKILAISSRINFPETLKLISPILGNTVVGLVA